MSRRRQFEHLQRATLERLRAHIPDGCPLRVERVASAIPSWQGYRVTGPGCDVTGRAQVVGSFIDGFVAGWRERGNDIGERADDHVELVIVPPPDDGGES